tara:strand:- start:69 stop:191 length:123 start_codon:yes stop_codon:yes gene_type:complete
MNHNYVLGYFKLHLTVKFHLMGVAVNLNAAWRKFLKLLGK